MYFFFWIFIEGIICHQRITFSRSARTYGIVIKYKSKDRRDKVLEGKPGGSLNDFIRVAKAKLHLEKAAPGSQFQSFFVTTHVVDG